MTKHQLVNELRQRQYEFGMVDRKIIDITPDDKIIDAYITCSCCGNKQVDGYGLEIAIQNANSSDQFLNICTKMSKANHRSN